MFRCYSVTVRSGRLLSILLLLQVERRLTAREIAERLEVSERTILRDMDALSAAGVPVIADRGSGGGWRLLDDYQTRLTGLTSQEIQALLLAAPGRWLADLDLHHAAEAALLKLLASVPAPLRRDAEFARERLLIDPTSWRGEAPENLASLPALQAALWQDRRIRFEYRQPDLEACERQVSPLGLVVKGAVWYLVALCDGKTRTYRVSRIGAVQLLDEPVARPPDFDLAEHWKHSAAEFRQVLLKSFQATFRVAPEGQTWLRWPAFFGRIETIAPAGTEGWTMIDVRFDVIDQAVRFALSFGGAIEVLGPPELRQRVRDELACAVLRYDALP